MNLDHVSKRIRRFNISKTHAITTIRMPYVHCDDIADHDSGNEGEKLKVVLTQCLTTFF